MKNNKNLYILCSGDVEMNIQINEVLYQTLFSKIDNVAFVDLKLKYNNFYNKDHSFVNNSYNYKTLSINTISELSKLLKQDCVIFSLVSHRPKDWIVFFLAKIYKTKIIYQNPLGETVKVNMNAGSVSRAHSFMRAFKPINLFSLTYAAFAKLGIFQNIDTFYTTESYSKVKYKNNKSYNRVKVINSKFYDAFLKNKNSITEEYIVFIDSIIPSHGDQLRMGYVSMDSTYYYYQLNLFFALLEKITSKKVIICLHPKYDEKNLKQDFPNNLAVKYKSDLYIPKASLVLFHESSLTNYALIYNKKLLQLTSKKFNDFVLENIKSWFNAINPPQLEFDNDLTKNQVMKILQKHKNNGYKNFFDSSIVGSGVEGEFGSNQILNDIQHHYKIK
jgi:hypothetical protein